MTLWLRRTGTGNMSCGDAINLDDSPCPGIQACGIGGGNTSQYWIEDDGRERERVVDKPPYRVPLMNEIRALPWNGFKVASTFSGCGGSCLGYRMAGFKVVWANEFVPAAQVSYKANADPDCFLDCRDIHAVKPEEILAQTGLVIGELDLLDGSPPCQAFSTAGKREKGWGQKKKYEHGAAQCNETLFDEYVRILRGLKPKVFVAENVSGLVKGTAKGYFLQILAALKASGYRVTCRVLDAQWLGVPQQRQRTIFVGVREDLGLDPVHPKPLAYRYSVRDALQWIGQVVHDTSGLFGAGDVTDRPSPAITIGVNSVNSNHFKVDDGYAHVAKSGSELPVPSIRGGRVTKITGLVGSQFERVEVPTFLQQEDSRPCRVVTSDDSFGSRGIVHRKFTITELKRICAFPDDFVLLGSYAQQWERLGNSVPPVMMAAIAREIRDQVLIKVKP